MIYMDNAATTIHKPEEVKATCFLQKLVTIIIGGAFLFL